MRAARIHKFGPRNVIVIEELPRPSTLRDNMLKWIPVVDPEQGRRSAGYISARKIIAYVLKETRVLS